MMEGALNSYQVFKDSDDEFKAAIAERAKTAATGIFAFLRTVKKHHFSPMVRERALMLEKRYLSEIGQPTLLSRAVSTYISRNIRKSTLDTPKIPVSDPQPRWSYYCTFGDDIWIKKGREAEKIGTLQRRQRPLHRTFYQDGKVITIRATRMSQLLLPLKQQIFSRVDSF